MFYRLGDRGGDNQGNNSVTIYSTLFKLITERRSPLLIFLSQTCDIHQTGVNVKKNREKG